MANYYDDSSSKDGSYPGSRIVMYKEKPATNDNYFSLNDCTLKYNENISYFVNLGYGYYYSGNYAHFYYSPRTLNYKISTIAIGPITDPRDCPIPAKWEGIFSSDLGLQCYSGFIYSFKYESGYCWDKRNDYDEWEEVCYANGFWILLIGGGGGGGAFHKWLWHKYGGGGGGGGGAVIGFVNLRAMSAIQKVWYLSVGTGGAAGDTGDPTFFADASTYANIKYGLVAGGGHGASKDSGGEGGTYEANRMYDSNFNYFFYTCTRKGNLGGKGAEDSSTLNGYEKVSTQYTHTNKWATLKFNNESSIDAPASGYPQGGQGAPAPGAGHSTWGRGGHGGNTGTGNSGKAGTALILSDNNTGD